MGGRRNGGFMVNATSKQQTKGLKGGLKEWLDGWMGGRRNGGFMVNAIQATDKRVEGWVKGMGGWVDGWAKEWRIHGGFMADSWRMGLQKLIRGGQRGRYL
jgi:hypothetical protein